MVNVCEFFEEQHLVLSHSNVLLLALNSFEQLLIARATGFELLPGAKSNKQHEIKADSDRADANCSFLAFCGCRHDVSFGLSAAAAWELAPVGWFRAGS